MGVGQIVYIFTAISKTKQNTHRALAPESCVLCPASAQAIYFFIFYFFHLKLLINTVTQHLVWCQYMSGAEISAFQNLLSSWSSVAIQTPISNTYSIPIPLHLICSVKDNIYKMFLFP